MRDDTLQKVMDDYEEWIDATGAVTKFSSWYFELQSIVEDAFNAGKASVSEVSDG